VHLVGISHTHIYITMDGSGNVKFTREEIIVYIFKYNTESKDLDLMCNKPTQKSNFLPKYGFYFSTTGSCMLY
jgi:hypothetical protein